MENHLRRSPDRVERQHRTAGSYRAIVGLNEPAGRCPAGHREHDPTSDYLNAKFARWYVPSVSRTMNWRQVPAQDLSVFHAYV